MVPTTYDFVEKEEKYKEFSDEKSALSDAI